MACRNQDRGNRAPARGYQVDDLCGREERRGEVTGFVNVVVRLERGPLRVQKIGVGPGLLSTVKNCSNVCRERSCPDGLAYGWCPPDVNG